MNSATQQIWHIILPTKLIKVTISELDQLYVGSEKGKVNNEWSESDYLVSESRFMHVLE